MSKTKIEWTDRTWNPVTGCTKVSQGCKNCYAERLYERFHGHGSFKNVLTHPGRLQQPLHWKKPSMVFVNSMSDLFHEDVDFYFIEEVFAIMYKCPQHTFQILTKRPKRMLKFFDWLNGRLPIAENIWIGVSCEDQATADERIPLLLQVSAAVRFLSCEPLLGDINLQYYKNGRPAEWLYKLHWVIAGGESGPHARPMHPDWVRSLRDQCAAAGVAFFFKQWGEYKEGSTGGTPINKWNMVGNDGKIYNDIVPGGLRSVLMSKVGKKEAGNLLDGKQHLEFPKTTHA